MINLTRLGMHLPKGTSTSALCVFIPLLVLGGALRVNAQRAHCSAPNVLVALDRSGSMYQFPDPAYELPPIPNGDVEAQLERAALERDHAIGRRRDLAEIALARVVAAFDDRVKFGLAMFPQGGTRCTPGRLPFVGRLDDGQLHLELGASDLFRSQLRRHNLPFGHTPLASAIASYSPWLQELPGRKAMILVTDGGESCGRNQQLLARARASQIAGVPVYVIGFLVDETERAALDQLAQAGGTVRAYNASNARDIQTAVEQILRPLFREECDGLDNDCDGRIDENYAVDGPCATGGQGACGSGRWVCDDGGGRVCEAIARPSLERCDGMDNDCDGDVDEGDPESGSSCPTGRPGTCGQGVRVCVDGRLTCLSGIQPRPEVCNGQDDDCDGASDEGNPESGAACRTGRPAACGAGIQQCVNGRLACQALDASESEVCDGLDNDCDGAVDEKIPGSGQACRTGGRGQCAEGVLACVLGEMACEAMHVPEADICDMIDNDCDGRVDEDSQTVGQACATGLTGRCAEGSLVCIEGSDQCVAQIAAELETCDGEDNDCDGQIDESLRNRCGRCGGDVQEACNGLDEDCDGQMDENAPCVGDSVCAHGRCVELCHGNECLGDLRCVDGHCLNPCEFEGCQHGFDCVHGVCQAVCDQIQCPQGQICQAGVCQDGGCGPEGCLPGELCRGGWCEADLCADVQCEVGQFCRLGDCVQSCAHLSCPYGMACSDGRCVADACAGIECDDGSYCVDGECMADPCVPERCESGEVCADGRCLPNPCLGIRCEPGQTCHLVLGSAQCTYAHPLETELPTSSTESQVSSPDPSRTDGDDRLLMPVFETTPGEGNTLSEDPRSEVSAQVEGGGCNALSSERSGSLGLGLLFLVWALRYGRYSRRFGVFLSS